MNNIEEKYWTLISKSLSDNLTQEEERELNTWLSADPAHLKLLQELEESWNAADQFGSHFSPDKDKAWKVINSKIDLSSDSKSQAPVRNLYSWVKAAAAVFILLTGGWFLWTTVSQQKLVTIASTDAIKEILLPDSSKVWLSNQSSISYYQKMDQKDEREILLEGEAYFEIHHNPSKPFIVKALETETKVLGTSFNVLARTDSSLIEVSVVTGKVQFSNAETETNKLLLEPGTKGVFTRATNEFNKRKTESENFLYWKNKKLMFSNVTVKQALEEIEKTHGIKFIIQDQSVASKRITTSFENETLEQIINELKLLLDVEIKRTNNTYLVSTIK